MLTGLPLDRGLVITVIPPCFIPQHPCSWRMGQRAKGRGGQAHPGIAAPLTKDPSEWAGREGGIQQPPGYHPCGGGEGPHHTLIQLYSK